MGVGKNEEEEWLMLKSVASVRIKLERYYYYYYTNIILDFFDDFYIWHGDIHFQV